MTSWIWKRHIVSWMINNIKTSRTSFKAWASVSHSDCCWFQRPHPTSSLVFISLTAALNTLVLSCAALTSMPLLFSFLLSPHFDVSFLSNDNQCCTSSAHNGNTSPLLLSSRCTLINTRVYPAAVWHGHTHAAHTYLLSNHFIIHSSLLFSQWTDDLISGPLHVVIAVSQRHKMILRSSVGLLEDKN